MSKWFFITLLITILSSFFALAVRIEDKKEAKRMEEGEFSADDFEIIEEDK